LRILWELRGAPATFRDLQQRCGGVSPTLLNTRLRELRESGIVKLSDDGYQLTDLGQELGGILMPFHYWAEKWAGQTAQADSNKTK
jgi:DNA-binding HxlR family transcriptional regulator